MGEAAGLIREIRIEPEPGSWGEALARSWERARQDEACLRLRAGLGLPTDRPVIMTGHQPGFWHLGILSKFFAAQAVSEVVGGAAAWIVPDQDDADPGELMIPVEDAQGRLMRRAVRVLPEPMAGVAAGSTAAMKPLQPDMAGASAGVRAGVLEAARRCGAHAGASSLAAQAASAASDALRGVLPPAPLVFASRLLERDEAWGFVRVMLEDGPRAAEAYNRAVAAHQEAGVSPLAVRGGRAELPLWRLRAGVARERVWSDRAAESPRTELAPRALLMTSILRRFVCDLFIHGIGGWEYDRVCERWMREWRGESIAPMGLVTASVLLDMGRGEPVGRADAARAVWRAHHARHDPAMLGRVEVAARKRELVREIAREREGGGNPAVKYGELSALLRSYREESREGLDALEREADGALARAAEADILGDRAWPFVLHPRESLLALRARIREAFGVSA